MRTKTLIKFKQHVPSFVSGVEPLTCEVKTVKELLEVPWIKKYLTSGNFSNFCRSPRYPKGTLLMVENEEGTSWWVVGWAIKGDISELPKAKMKK